MHKPSRLETRHIWLRRRALLGIFGFAPFFAVSQLRAQDGSAFLLRADDGAMLQNFRVPSELDPATLPGVIWTGARSADVILYEFFDYNCAYCRKAALEIEAISKYDQNLKVGLVNNAVLSVGSVQAAKVQQAILRLYGPGKAHEFHLKMYAAHGTRNGDSALALVRSIGLDAQKVEESADSDMVAGVLTRQARLAAGLGMAMTPSFVIAGVAILGWPGATSLKSMIANARKCDRPTCGDNE
jgi:protein-disulfide isomerase